MIKKGKEKNSFLHASVNLESVCSILNGLSSILEDDMDRTETSIILEAEQNLELKMQVFKKSDYRETKTIVIKELNIPRRDLFEKDYYSISTRSVEFNYAD